MGLKKGFPALCAHRGLSSVCPENTLPAFGAAVGLGVSEIELDLWMSRDGVCVVCHDEDLSRTTGAGGRIPGMAWEEIRKLDAGMKFSPEWAGVKIPRFEEVIDVAKNKAVLNVHIKQPGPAGELVRKACRILRESGMAGESYIIGDEAVLKAALDAVPEIQRGCRPVELAVKYGCGRVQLGREVGDEEIRKAKSEGLLCNLFFSDEPGEAAAYIQRGIDVVLTNAANLLIAGGVCRRS